MVLAKAVLILPLVGACARPPQKSEIRHLEASHTTERATNVPAVAAVPIRWAADTRTANPTVVTDDLRDLASQCGEVDGRLNEAARWLAGTGPLGKEDDDIDRLRFALRASGTPYVTPQAWSRSTPRTSEVPDADEFHAFTRWLESAQHPSFRRCGLARVELADRRHLFVLVSAALAELKQPLPTRTRVGQWLELVAELRLEAVAAKVVLLGPTLEPWTVPTQLRGKLVRARFAAASPGRWELQLVVDAGQGPQQVLEALVFVDAQPSPGYRPEPAPGEEARLGMRATPEAAITTMLNALRARTGRPPLTRDAALDRLAVMHAESMRRERRLAHDIGDGGTWERLTTSDISVRWAGENVAHASSPLRVHRALWASPSHRANLLDGRFSRWGLGVARDADDSLWVCELFASSP